MLGLTFPQATVVLLSGPCVAFVFLKWVSRTGPWSGATDGTVFPQDPEPTAFLFEDEALVDATPSARRLLDLAPHAPTPWARFVSALRPMFPTLADDLRSLSDTGRLTLTATGGTGRIEAVFRLGLAHITVVGAEDEEEGPVTVDRLTLRALSAELEALRGLGGEVPYMTWREDAGGNITWANAAYLQTADRFVPSEAAVGWPPHRLFQRAPPAAVTEPRRLSVELPDGDLAWFEVSDHPVGTGALRVAMPVDAVVRAERSRLEFIQTLTRTFATLTVGLAIFDRSRRLALFNPAVSDLTGLRPGFMAARPRLFDFIEALREQRVMPEPKNYENWRHRLATLETEAEQGTFAETWTLPDGEVYEVTGRPHPDGAIAFLIKDISAEIRLTRQFRSELRLNQAAFDALDTAIAVFGPDGGLRLTNAAYCRLWDIDPATSLDAGTLPEAIGHWRRLSPDSPDWDRIPPPGSRAGEVSFHLEQAAGQRLVCSFTPLTGGAMLATFSIAAAPRLQPQRDATASTRDSA